MGNTFGEILRLTTWGESHGPAIGAVLDGCPAGLKVTEKLIQDELDRRSPRFKNPASTSRNEDDKVEILSGIFEGKTTGAPISMIIYNTDQRPKDYGNLKDLYRPGHADLAYELKYGVRDYRGGGRSSGRETACRVMGGAIAKALLKEAAQTEIYAYTKQIGQFGIPSYTDWPPALKLENSRKNNICCPDPEIAKKMERYIIDKKTVGESVGGIVEIVVKNPPVGLGEPCFDKLHADLGKALLSIGTVKGFEIGSGFGVADMDGSENNDSYVMKSKTPKDGVNLQKNYAGGIQGGISIGADIIMRVAIKPPSSIGREQSTIDKKGNRVSVKIEGRHDACIIPRFIPVAEAMVALTLADHLLRNKAGKILQAN